MRTIQTFILSTILLCFACSKENTSEQVNISVQSNAEAINDLPIDDLGTDTFFGFTGGLYPNGLNSPTGRYSIDLLQISNQIVPLDTFGNPSLSPKSKILFISMGGSTGGHNMKSLISRTKHNPKTNPKLLLISCNQTGYLQPLNNILNPDDSCWDHVTELIQAHKASYRQVQVLYLETDDSTRNISFPGRAMIIKDDIEACVRTLKQKFKNLRIVYLLARTRTFGNDTRQNAEPSPYFFGWACKFAIEDQIKGVSGTGYRGDNAVAPMMTWGFYQWALDAPRKTDGFSWTQSETKDNLHATPAGQDTLSKRFQNFLLTDKYAKNWYAAQ